MKKNFKHLFDDKKIFGFYSDELFVAVIVGLSTAVPVYMVAYNSHGILGRLGGLLLLLITGIVAGTVLSTMKLVRGNDDKTFYVKIIGRNEEPKSFKGLVTKIILYLMAFDRLKGKNGIKKTQNYSP